MGVGGLIPIEEMWHNKLKQRLVFWHRARHSSQKPKEKEKTGGGGDFFFLVCKCESRVRLGCPRFWLPWSSVKEWRRARQELAEGFLQNLLPPDCTVVRFLSFLKKNPRHQLLTLKQCGTLCFINKTSETHAGAYECAILG